MARTSDTERKAFESRGTMRLRITVGIIMGIFGVVLVIVMLAVNS